MKTKTPLLFVGSLLPSLALAGEPILLPDFMAVEGANASLAFMLQDQVKAELEKDGNIILSSTAARPVVGGKVDNCFEIDSCPYAALQQLPARVGITVRLFRDSANGGALTGEVEFYEQSDPTPMDTYSALIVPGQEAAFAFDVRTKTQDLMSLLGSAPAGDLIAAVKLMEAARTGGSGYPQPGYNPGGGYPPNNGGYPPNNGGYPPNNGGYQGNTGNTGNTGGYDPNTGNQFGDPPPTSGGYQGPDGGGDNNMGPPDETGPTGPPIDTALDRNWQDDPLEDLLEGTDVAPKYIVGAEANFRKLEMDARDWMFKAMPHGGRVVVEVRGGLGSGDVDRQADVRVDVDGGGAEQSNWFQEGPLPNNRPRGGLFVGYAPTALLDLGVLFGLQYGKKGLTTGWTQNGTGGEASAVDFVDAVQFYIQPRLRLYMAPTGPVKPYVTGLAESRIFDGYDIESSGTINYPEPPGGYVYGGGGGAGIVFDPGPIVGFLLEGTFVKHFGTRAGPAQQGLAPAVTPTPPTPGGYTIGVALGAQFRL